MMKFITKIIAFTLTFVFSVALVGFPQTDLTAFDFVIKKDLQTQQNISSLLQRDIRNGEKRDKNLDEIDFPSESSAYFEAYTTTIDEYTAKSSSMNDADLPLDFQIAWREHMQAWHDYADFLKWSKTVKMEDSEFSQLDKSYDRGISLTWREVLRIGRNYGVTISY